MTDIFVVEMWSDHRHWQPGGEAHIVSEEHLASTLEGAIEWCKKYPDYGGTPEHGAYYYPWHFRVVRKKLDEDTMDVIGGGTYEIVWRSDQVEEEDDFSGHIDLEGLKGYERAQELLEKLPNLLRDIAEVVEDHLG